MLLNCDRNRMNAPRFVPSGNRLDPYFLQPACDLAGVEAVLRVGIESLYNLISGHGVPG